MIRLMSIAAVLLACLIPDRGHAQPFDAASPLDQIVTFGDSLSDSGNAFLLIQEFAVRPFEPIPRAPYLIGRFRFSNGPTWIERLSRDLGIPRSGRPAFGRPGVYTNYAVGGARARPEGPQNLGTQVDAFLITSVGKVPPDALYALWIGSNDLRDALAALPDNPGSAERIVQQALLATGEAITRLAARGGESFLVVNLPNLAVTPAVRDLGLKAQAVAEALSQRYNSELEELLQELEGRLGPEVVILRFDVSTVLDEAAADPKAFGLLNGTRSCITPGVVRGAICPRPSSFLFWDFIHPTQAAHRLLAGEVREVLAIP